jgi:hypothetical protein
MRQPLTEAGQDGIQQQTPPCPETSQPGKKVTIMNSKLLFAATVAISVLSSVAMADEATAAEPVTRAQVQSELADAIANKTLQRTDYDADRPSAAVSTRTRADVAADLAVAKTARKALLGPDANRNYNPYGTEIFARSTLTRAEVKSEVLQAAAAGTLQRTDYDDAAVAARRANQHTAAPTRLAQRVKALFSSKQS